MQVPLGGGRAEEDFESEGLVLFEKSPRFSSSFSSRFDPRPPPFSVSVEAIGSCREDSSLLGEAAAALEAGAAAGIGRSVVLLSFDDVMFGKTAVSATLLLEWRAAGAASLSSVVFVFEDAAADAALALLGRRAAGAAFC